MKYLGTKEIETTRLFLRKWKENDYISMFNNYAKKEIVTKYLTWDPYKDIENAKYYVKNNNMIYDESTFRWAITLKENKDEVIGNIDAVKLDKEKEEIEIGYVLSDTYWNKGIMSEALKAVTKYLFINIDIKRIIIRCLLINEASYKVMKKCGYKDLDIKKELHKGKLTLIRTTYLNKSDYLISF